jgi:hypothetical protein
MAHALPAFPHGGLLARLCATVVVVTALGSGCEPDVPAGEGEGEGEGEGDACADQPAPSPPSQRPRSPWSPAAIELCSLTSRALPGSGARVVYGRCGGNDPDGILPAAVSAAIAARCEEADNDVSRDFEAALTEGRVALHLDAIRACADATVGSINLAPAVCDPALLLTPLVAPGEPCIQGWDCPAGTHCEAPDLFADALRCLAPAGPGEACSGALRTCEEALRCSDDDVCAPRLGRDVPCSTNDACDAGLFCPEGACVPFVALGEACVDGTACGAGGAAGGPAVDCVAGVCRTLIDDGAVCDDVDRCRTDCTTCRPDDVDGTLRCLPHGEDGAPCGGTVDCRHGFICDAGGHRCIPGNDEGGPCTTIDDCRDETLACGADGRCIPRGTAGEVCDPAVPSACREGRCVVTDADGPRCSLGTVLDGCGVDGDCVAEAVCVCGTCAPPPTSGPCSDGRRCGAGFSCDGTRCQPAPGIGDACDALACDDGLFCAQDGQCAAAGEAGAACIAGSACASGDCTDGRCTATASGCSTDPGFFRFLLMLALLPPVRRFFGARRRREPSRRWPG